jgi:predicted small lipoprotein YifL
MKTKLTNALLLFVVMLSSVSCGLAGPELPPEIIPAMNTYADQYDTEHPGDEEWNIARLCINQPIALYWNRDSRMWEVVCEIDVNTYGHTYGVVMIDSASNTLIYVDHISAYSFKDLEDLIADGWERR